MVPWRNGRERGWGVHDAMTMKEPIEIAAIEAALTTLLGTIDEQHAKYRERPSRRSESGSLLRDPATISPVESLIDDPIGQSCRLGIRRLGERLNELDEGRSGLMSEVVDRVGKRNDGWAEELSIVGGMVSAIGWPSLLLTR